MDKLDLTLATLQKNLRNGDGAKSGWAEGVLSWSTCVSRLTRSEDLCRGRQNDLGYMRNMSQLRRRHGEQIEPARDLSKRYSTLNPLYEGDSIV